MSLKWSAVVVIFLAGYSMSSFSKAVTGKIVVDGTIYSSESSVVIKNGKVLQGTDKGFKGNGHRVTEKRQLSSFNRLFVGISANIEYIASDYYHLELTADDNLVSVITSKISGDTLSINVSQPFVTQDTIRIKIYGTPSLNSLIVDGSSDVSLRGISGDSFEIILDGVGDITAHGTVTNLAIQIDGSGDVNTKTLQADTVSIDVDGSADVTVTANKTLDVVIDGVSDVTYYGHPSSISKTIDGAGEVSTGN